MVDRPAWAEDRHPVGPLMGEAAKERRDPAASSTSWKGERPRHPRTPRSSRATAEIKVETTDTRHRVLDDTVRSRPRAQCQDIRRLPSSLTPQDLRCWDGVKRGGAGSAHRRSASRTGIRPRTHSEHRARSECAYRVGHGRDRTQQAYHAERRLGERPCSSSSPAAIPESSQYMPRPCLVSNIRICR